MFVPLVAGDVEPGSAIDRVSFQSFPFTLTNPQLISQDFDAVEPLATWPSRFLKTLFVRYIVDIVVQFEQVVAAGYCHHVALRTFCEGSLDATSKQTSEPNLSVQHQLQLCHRRHHNSASSSPPHRHEASVQLPAVLPNPISPARYFEVIDTRLHTSGAGRS